MKDSFILYQEHKEIFETLTDEEAGKLIKAIFEYEDTGQTNELDKSLKLAFIPIKNALDRNKDKYEKVVERNKENGKKGGRPKNPKNPVGYLGYLKKPKKADSDSDNEHDNESDSDIKKKKKKKSFEDVFTENAFSTELENTLKDFIDMRKTIKKPMTTKALELLIRNLEKLTNLEEEKIAILNQSIEHGWQTVYPLKISSSNKNANSGINDFKELWEEAQNDQAGNYTSNNSFGW